MVMTEYTYVFAIGTMFALLEAYNNGASTFYLSILQFDLELTLEQTMLLTLGLHPCPPAPLHTDKPWLSVCASN
jgi:hypothetical protein